MNRQLWSIQDRVDFGIEAEIDEVEVVQNEEDGKDIPALSKDDSEEKDDVEDGSYDPSLGWTGTPCFDNVLQYLDYSFLQIWKLHDAKGVSSEDILNCNFHH